MPDSVYDLDVLVWSEQQGALLRRIAAGERPNETLDWSNIAEEIESVGRSELSACTSLLRQALAHLIKLHVQPDSLAAAHWMGEIVAFLSDAKAGFSPSMKSRIDIASIYKDAARGVTASLHGHKRWPSIPQTCPYTLDDLLSPTAHPDELARRLNTPPH